MRISQDNQMLFSASKDGTLMIYDIKDRDTKGPAVKKIFGGIPQFSKEILTEKTEMEEFENIKDTLENENAAANDSQNGVDNKMGTNQ